MQVMVLMASDADMAAVSAHLNMNRLVFDLTTPRELIELINVSLLEFNEITSISDPRPVDITDTAEAYQSTLTAEFDGLTADCTITYIKTAKAFYVVASGSTRLLTTAERQSLARIPLSLIEY